MKEVVVSEFTVREVAERERVSQRTVRRWIEKGAVIIRKTPGGGVRVLLASQYQQSTVDIKGHPSK